MGIIAWIIFGLIAGALARLIMPGTQGMGILWTLLLGLAGALAGGFIAAALGFGGVDGFNIWSFVLAVGGAVLLLFIYGLVTGGRERRAA